MLTLRRRKAAPWKSTAHALLEALDCRDATTANHCRRVAVYADLLAGAMRLSTGERERLHCGALIHDIGKLGVGEAILHKPSRLNDREFETIKAHTWKGAAMLARLPGMGKLMPLVRSHHERWDGTGYPDGLRGLEISRLARILAVADSFDAMTALRPYSSGLLLPAALCEIEAISGTQFDPECVDVFVRLQPKLANVMGGQVKNSPRATLNYPTASAIPNYVA